MRKFTKQLIALTIPVLAGCMPVIEHDVYSPKVKGIISSSQGAPLSGITVSYWNGDYGETDADGVFRMKKYDSWNFYVEIVAPPGYIDIPAQSQPELLGLPQPDKSVTYLVSTKDRSIDIVIDIVKSEAGWVVYYSDRNRKNPLAQYLAENPLGDLARQVAAPSVKSEDLLTVGEFLTAHPDGDLAKFLQTHPESDLAMFLTSYGENINMQWRPVVEMLPGEAAEIVPNTRHPLALGPDPAPIELSYSGINIHFDSGLAEFLLKIDPALSSQNSMTPKSSNKESIP